MLNSQFLYSIVQIEMVFLDDLGNASPKINGTAFWIRGADGKPLLVTNKHNFYPAMKSTDYEGYKLVALKIQFREKQHGIFLKNIKFFEVDLKSLTGLAHKSADVALVIIPESQLLSELQNYGHTAIAYTEIANEKFFLESTEILDSLAFLGYPQKWFDAESHTPIAREANIASDPKKSFINAEIKTQDVTLVTGLSFGGSSGSPVVLLPKGTPYVQIHDYKYIGPKIIGIMTGHARDLKLAPQVPEDDITLKDKPLLGPYSGLSYYTRSTAIHDLLQQQNCEDIKEYICAKDLLEKFLKISKNQDDFSS